MSNHCSTHQRNNSNGSAASASARSADSRSIQSTPPTSCNSSAGHPLYAHDYSGHNLPAVTKHAGCEVYSTSPPSTASESSVSSTNDAPPDFGTPAFPAGPFESLSPTALPATSRDFSELFPSSRRLLIKHDDQTIDGNMNLRVDTPVITTQGRHRMITLFHMRMYDLRSRDFSVRRYCRDSGREVCHIARKSERCTTGRRPNIQRSLSNALAHIRSKADLKSHVPSPLKRHDSGYDSQPEEDEAERPISSHSAKVATTNGADCINLEFSNYAHVDVNRRGLKANKRYDFDYWGSHYSWQRSTNKVGLSTEVSYKLLRRDDNKLVANIVPEHLTTDEANAEIDQGGWVPPCVLRILDHKILKAPSGDIADVVVATGLVALVDDCIRRHFQARERQQLIVASPTTNDPQHRRAHGRTGPFVKPQTLIEAAFG